MAEFGINHELEELLLLLLLLLPPLTLFPLCPCLLPLFPPPPQRLHGLLVPYLIPEP